MSITTNRIALSSIKDTHLNSSSVSPSNTPTKDRKRPTLFNSIRKPTHGHSASVSRTDLFTKSFALANSATTLNKKFSPLRAVSFSDYRSTSNNNGATPGLRLQSTNDAFKNDTAGLAATKLKLKLQLAYYKVQQNKETRLKSMKYNTTSKSAYKSTAIKLNSVIASLESPPTSAKNSPTPTSASGPFDSPDYHSIIKPSAVLPTPPDQQKPTVMNYSHSINVNLNATPSHKSSFNAITNPTKSRLNKIANKKGTAKRSQKLKLFQIKKNSVYYNSNQKKLPLIQKQEQFGMDIVNHSTSFSAPSSQGNTTANNAGNSQGVNFSFINYPQSQESTTGNSHLPSIILNPPTTTTTNTSNSTSSYLKHHEQKTSLPSINKILKTPIKRANSMRPPSHFLFQTSFNDAAPLVVPGSQSQGNPNDETIIDEDNEMTIIQNTTINNTTIDQNATIEVNDDDDDDKTTNNKQQDILTSSPLHNQQFTTPNKFSVAKSLLQLGGHRM
ncbi:hypothetical protein Cantr_08666 [Candida viswanathii]|uniref:Uncharacterized protein n=1 Tax=Candida viswanathii TaxID=5486 RepID=A0A367Y645_9ASCO|nr:hypothetical protein Cantr_08666 [Candida viswanathii]